MENIGNMAENSFKTGTGFSNPEIELSQPSNNSTIELSNPNISSANTERVAANISELKPKNTEVAGIEEKYSLEQEILGEGGPFDKYLNNKIQEMQKLNDSIDQHNAEVAIALGEEVPEEITDDDVERSKNVVLEKEPEEDKLFESEDDYVDELEKELSDDTQQQKNIKIVNSHKEETVEDNIIKPLIQTVDPANVSFEIDKEDIEELEDDENIEDSDEDENFAHLQAEITEKIAPVSRKLNISSFKRANRSVRANNVVKDMELKAADWALMSSGQKCSMKQFSGSTIDALTNTDGLTRTSIVNKRYKIFYDHIISENKPATLEQWVKSLSYFDNDHLYMNAYIASFAGSNYLPIDCPKCKNTFLTDNIDIEKMYTFNDDKAKERFNAIMRGEYGEVDELYVTEEVPISDKFCIVFREPSVYKMLFETSYLDDKFTKKYDGIISVLSYIDEILIIDQENQELIPIDYKRFPNNRVKDIKSRIIEYAKIINTLPPDQYNIIVAYINAISKIKSNISYQIPETVCPHCGNVIPARPISAEGLVFMRHQLAALAVTSIN